MKNWKYRDHDSGHKHKALVQKLLTCATAKCEQACHEHPEAKHMKLP